MKTFSDELAQHRDVMARAAQCSQAVESAAALLVSAFSRGNKVLLCGNGGSAADAQHIAAELVVRYAQKRRALPAIALTTDSSILTAHANDFEFASVFARQIEALGNAGDVLIAISTSGKSQNVLEAVKIARAKGLQVIGLTGEGGGALAELATLTIHVPSTVTARIQETHILIGHYWCGVVEDSVDVSQFT